MRIIALAAAVLLSLLANPEAACAACAGAQENDGICGNRGLMALHQQGETRLKVLVAAADPLTALLMRRDQRWAMEVVAGQDGGSGDEDDLQRKKRVLRRRLADLNRLVPGTIAEDIAGRWINALGNAKVERRGDGFAVEIVSRPDFGADLPAECRVKGELKLGSDGWYAGTPAFKEDGDDSTDGYDAHTYTAAAQDKTSGRASLRLRLQGNTLRAVISHKADVWLGACGGRDIFTGTYFLSGPGGRRTVDLAARTVAPSFECAGTRNSDEEEICSDPDLARLDADIARTYRDTLKRLDAKLGAALRDDERAWSKGNTGAFDIFLHPYWDKSAYYVIQSGNARTEWVTRFTERLAMLANIDEKRQGLVGGWLAYNAMLAIVPDKDEEGVVSAEGSKWLTGEHKFYCDFKGEGRIVDGAFKASDDMPKLRREGATLTVDGDDPDPDRNGFVDRQQPEYCVRLSSAKARLFPVKPAAYEIMHASDRIR